MEKLGTIPIDYGRKLFRRSYNIQESLKMC
jgi:hypothetical protein